MLKAQNVIEPVGPEGVVVPPRLRQLNEERVAVLVESMREIGLQSPITVRVGDRDDEGSFDIVLVAGRHRLEAARRLDWVHIDAIFVRGTEDEFRLWEIAENLHRSELTVLERAEHIAEWIRITESSSNKLLQVETVSKGGRGHQEGVRAASRKLNVDSTAAHRAIKIDSIAPEAKQAARDAGVDKFQSSLLKVAAAPAEAQVAKVLEIKSYKDAEREGRKTGVVSAAAEPLAADIETSAPEPSDLSAHRDAITRLKGEERLVREAAAEQETRTGPTAYTEFLKKNGRRPTADEAQTLAKLDYRVTPDASGKRHSPEGPLTKEQKAAKKRQDLAYSDVWRLGEAVQQLAGITCDPAEVLAECGLTHGDIIREKLEKAYGWLESFRKEWRSDAEATD